MAGIKSTSVVWKQIADMWNDYFTSPSRISSDEASKYDEWLRCLNKRNGNPRALVLGATPEIRDILSARGYRTTIIDINPEMVKAMDSLLKGKSNEKVVIANWLENALPSSSFDVVVGDAVLPNITWKEWPKLLSEVKRLLRPGGTFVTRAFCVPKTQRFNSTEELLDAFARKKPSNRAALEFTLEVMDFFYDHRSHMATFKASKDLLTSMGWNRGKRTGRADLDKTLAIVWDFWCTKFADKIFIYAYRDEEEALYRKFFSIKEAYEADHEYSSITPMYILEPLRQSL